jgi:hypothetical protein
MKVCMQAYVQTRHNFHTTYAAALKLCTVVHHQILSMFAKNHNSEFHFDQIMALFNLCITQLFFWEEEEGVARFIKI